ncbi:L,D-transpeptidase [Aureimonas sp. AU4]|uniref:L,D-transpeptidase family protein n=1 Tax=Aureimonas sp. AU4 TaxID=1638163 RepID=UPI000AB40AE5|nr:L,D-transpeptidase [Aureimonas sp. AU4]
MHRLSSLLGFSLLLLSGTHLQAAPLEAAAINEAEPGAFRERLAEAEQKRAQKPDEAAKAQKDPDTLPTEDEARRAAEALTDPDPFLIRLQVLLDRAHASPGVIDGLSGENTVKAIRLFEERRGLPVDGRVDDDVWQALTQDSAPAVKTYEITEKDVDGRYVKRIPTDYAELAKLKWVGYRGVGEMLGERFHMGEGLLEALNPDAKWTKAGTSVLVADPGPAPEGLVTRIEVDKSRGEILAYGEDGTVIMTAPATIGSEDTPSPSGDMKVERVAHNPGYTYNPKKNFQQGKNKELLEIAPGPNGPVGSVWIALTKPTYGIHGTPEPSKIDKTNSHGCVRLTNWDAEALAGIVEKERTEVHFLEEGQQPTGATAQSGTTGSPSADTPAQPAAEAPPAGATNGGGSQPG